MFQPQFEKHRSFFTWRGFPVIWIFTFSIPIMHHYSHVLKFWPLPQLVQISSFPIFNLGIILCIQNAMIARPRILNTPIIVWIGTLSYSLYIWQMPFTNPDVQSWATTFPQNILLAFLAAVISFYAVERPILGLRERRARPSHAFSPLATTQCVNGPPAQMKP